MLLYVFLTYYACGAISFFRWFMRDNVDVIDNWGELIGLAFIGLIFSVVFGAGYPLIRGFQAGTDRIKADPKKIAKAIGGRTKEEKLADKKADLDKRKRKIKELEAECL